MSCPDDETPDLVFTVPLGNAVELAAYFSYPNIPGSTESLRHTIMHWVTQSLDRDGLIAQGVSAKIETDSWTYTLYLSGSAVVSGQLLQYTKVLPQFIANCTLGITDMFNVIEANPAIWDPQKNGWRPMFPMGLPLVNQRSAQLFHYPPMNLLDPSRDYLDDAVPTRWAELLQANGMTDMSDIVLMERLIDCAPIAAGDDQGTYISQVLTPIDYYKDYQLAQFALLLTASATNPGFTIPLIVCGGPPRAVFSSLFGVTLGVNQAMRVNIVPGMTTPVLGANHPYYFYAQAQGFSTVGDGKMIAATCPKAQGIMQQDLVAARWQMLMATDPTQDPVAVLSACTSYWSAPAQAAAICAMVQHEGTLFYPTGTPAVFTFNTSLAQGAAFCQANGNNPCAG
jgi:hypothetical protein